MDTSRVDGVKAPQHRRTPRKDVFSSISMEACQGTRRHFSHKSQATHLLGGLSGKASARAPSPGSSDWVVGLDAADSISLSRDPVTFLRVLTTSNTAAAHDSRAASNEGAPHHSSTI